MYQWIKEKISLGILKIYEIRYALLFGILFILFVICFVTPWIYGSMKLGLMIFNGG